MQVRTIQPGPALADLVRCFQIVEAPEEATRTLLPDPGAVVAFRYRGAAALVEGGETSRIPDASITGPRGTCRRIRTSAGGGLVVAKLREDGAARLMGVPVNELYGAVLPADALAPRAAVDRATAQVAEATTDEARVAAAEAFLLAVGRRAPDRLVGAAVQAIRARRGCLRIAGLARQLGVGQDALEKRFLGVVGTSPKQLASLLRLHHAVELHLGGASLSSAPYQAGYYDQSHFIREFRAVTGEPPGRYFAAGTHG
ncbi:transcriptional regulator, AraC family [Anaeromyxobacter dehalogenans 2CP-1]|uniref:Transcriptional regulator, AraC family n=1 Tax=Anaeromyxobacter dehalogenans (strain ATCC BAA-258 / DSM 21875 / 2CP-1) TaxID=455488 RepID=B8JC10_ANAD2|nr:AraC family transcriptional regulator [Anaeromyxobacter dehalogenans]ACL63932.1 transcriptional regulator, AraC family [Anaeromyxobacter dehalogenans 2CP-1]